MTYTLSHIITGYTFGLWDSYEAAECYRNSLDDWTMWDIDRCF